MNEYHLSSFLFNVLVFFRFLDFDTKMSIENSIIYFIYISSIEKSASLIVVIIVKVTYYQETVTSYESIHHERRQTGCNLTSTDIGSFF
jgi:hypothetical protein